MEFVVLMTLVPPRVTRTGNLFPDTMLFRSGVNRCMKRKQARISAPVSCPVMPRRWLPPDRHLLLRLGLHRAAGLAAVGLAERRQVDQRPVGAPLARCVHGDGGAAAGFVLGHLLRPPPCPAIEKRPPSIL